MESPVSTHDKKSFIYWFLTNYHLKRRESTWILKYLIHHQELLKNVHFVEYAKYCPIGIMISTHCAEEAAFCFYKNHLVTTDADKTFHDIRLNKEDPIYIQLNFKNAYQNAFYAAVLEKNPYEPVQDHGEYAAETEALLNKMKIQTCYKNIDIALENNEREMFYYWSNELKALLKETHDQPIIK